MDTKIFEYILIEKIYENTCTLVYRAVTETTDKKPDSVIIKIMRQEYPTFKELLQFRNQYTIIKNLNTPGVIQSYSLEKYHNGYALIMEDFGGISLREYSHTTYLSLLEILNIAIQITEILQTIHQNRIIHKDIKPANILINPHTKQIKIIDFSIASLLPKETQEIKNPNSLEGTLAYIAPEQTGRMNRGIDYRADFYSFGVTLFELLTGQLPFTSDDPMELLHCHIAKSPPNIHNINSQIPLVVSSIVNKMMAKNAEERYQSALGLKYDLEKCLKELESTGNITDFIIGTKDISDRFLIPEKLYGREVEVNKLLATFANVANGKSELMLVTGFSGIGKTAVINEIHKPIVQQQGYFIKGKFDQFNRNIPFSAFVQAFRDLMEKILSESDEKLQIWQTKILEKLGENGQIIIEVIPELEKIIGPQKPPVQISGIAAKNRFNLLFKQFIEIFTAPAHPLVIFLDDLQWIDPDSLNLIKLLITQSQAGYLLLIVAYRNNEVFPGHSLIFTLDEVKKSGIIVHTIKLEPLNWKNLNQLVADTLNCELKLAQPLTNIVKQKTRGNPFFATQFLKSLHQNKLINFDTELRSWKCDITQLKELVIQDDVVEFMAKQLQKLPTATQDILKLAACIGNKFDLHTLSIVYQKSAQETAGALWQALQEGFIVPQNDIYKFYIGNEQPTKENYVINYKFLHDRIQQAAYSLIPEIARNSTHLIIGELLLNNTPEIPDKIFEIVNHLNLGQNLINDSKKRHYLAELNLIAANKAKIATAYDAAMNYLLTGLDLLGDNSWRKEYKLTLSFYDLAIETAYLKGDFAKTAELVAEIGENATTLLDKISTYQIQIQAYTVQGKHLEAIELGCQILEKLGIYLPVSPTESEVKQTLLFTQLNLQTFSIEDLLNQPLMTDLEKIAAMKILPALQASSYIAVPPLYPLIACQQVNLSLEYGNSIFAPVAYINYGLVLNGITTDIIGAYNFGELGIKLLEKLDVKASKTQALNIFAALIAYVKLPLKEILIMLQSAYHSSFETGDFLFGGYAAMNYCQYSYFSGRELTRLSEEIAHYNLFLGEIKQENALSWNTLHYQAVLNLLGENSVNKSLENQVNLETEILTRYEEAKDRLGLHFFYLHKMIFCYLLNNIIEAEKNREKAQEYLDGAIGLFNVPVFYFYDSLICLHLYDNKSLNQSEILKNRIKYNQDNLQKLAIQSPINFQHKYILIEAEKARILNQKAEAIELFDKAISLAQKNEYIQEEAIANELAAKFYLGWSKEKVAAGYMQEAYYCYARWGAKAKIDNLEKHYPQLLQPILQPQKINFNPFTNLGNLNILSSQNLSSQSVHQFPDTISHNLYNAIDLNSVIKAAQSLSGTIALDDLLKQLTQIILQNSGADKCILLFPNDENQWQVKAIATNDKITLLSQPLDNNPNLPVKLIQYVKNTQKTVLIENCTTDLPVIDDYLLQRQPKNLLCLPIINQREMVGILYLKNELLPDVFTSDRLLVINFLCNQAAIALKNAQLYQKEQEKSQQLERLNSMFKAQQEAELDGILVINEKRQVVSYNRRFVELWGIPNEIIETKNDHQLLNYVLSSIQNPEEFISLVEYLYDHPQEQAYHEVLLKNQQVFERYTAPIISENQQYYGRIWCFRDISDRKNAEAQLQESQLQIMQNEKMSALGNLMAGIAHEINNPIGFIAGNIIEIQNNLKSLINHLNLYQNQASSYEINDHAEAIELEYILEDLPKIINSMQIGCDRIKNISTSLRIFSRADHDYKVLFNIHEGIDSTLLILKHRLKGNEKRPEIKIIKNYGDIPPIQCFPGQLNQVFMNILANAIDMFEEMTEIYSLEHLKKHTQQITIKTEILINTQQIAIHIIDNGLGMTENIKKRIFENLFTTKSVGKGTGLGLAIARQIIENKHKGSITVNSQPGQGTEFILLLPK